MENLIKQIASADELTLNDCIFAVLRRFNSIRTDRELIFMTLPTDPKLRDAELENNISFLRSCCKRQNAEKNPED